VDDQPNRIACVAILAPSRIDDAWTPQRAVLATVFINRRGATTAGSMRKSIKAAPRTWMDRTGSFRVEAELKEINDSKVHLLKQNGVRVAVPLEKLSKVDLYHLNMVRSTLRHRARCPWRMGSCATCSPVSILPHHR